jgi:hypothetical protein
MDLRLAATSQACIGPPPDVKILHWTLLHDENLSRLFFRYFVDHAHRCGISARSHPLLASNLLNIHRESRIRRQHHLLSELLVKESPQVTSTRLTPKTIFSTIFGIQLCNL